METSGTSSTPPSASNNAANLVLLVDDNAAHRELCHAFLKRYGYRIEFAETGRDAIQTCKTLRPDCVLLDYRLPDLDGLEVLRELAINPGLAGIPVVMLTAVADQRTAIEALKTGALDYLQKEELNRESLARAVRFAIERSKLQRMEHKLRDTERLAALGQLAAGVAHEVNNPAASVLNNLSVASLQLEELERHAQQSKDAQAVRVVSELRDGIRDSLDGIRRISSITQDLAILAHSGPNQRAPINLLDLAKSTAKLLQVKSADRCQVEVVDAQCPIVLGDRRLLMQLVLQLMDNAIDAIQPGKPRHNSVCVVASWDSTSIRLDVEDTGSGIAAECMSQIFDPFFTTKTIGSGTGLGLALSRSIAQQHNGDIQFEPLTRGSRFSLLLPLEPQEHLASLMPARQARATGGKLLIVDDERAVLRSLRRVLQKHYSIITAADAETAYLAVRDHDFDVVLCDLSMPHTSGVEVYDYLAEKHPKLARRLMFLSAASATDRLRHEAATRPCPLLLKPVEVPKLIEAIEQRKLSSQGAMSYSLPSLV